MILFNKKGYYYTTCTYTTFQLGYNELYILIHYINYIFTFIISSIIKNIYWNSMSEFILRAKSIVASKQNAFKNQITTFFTLKQNINMFAFYLSTIYFHIVSIFFLADLKLGRRVVCKLANFFEIQHKFQLEFFLFTVYYDVIANCMFMTFSIEQLQLFKFNLRLIDFFKRQTHLLRATSLQVQPDDPVVVRIRHVQIVLVQANSSRVIKFQLLHLLADVEVAENFVADVLVRIRQIIPDLLGGIHHLDLVVEGVGDEQDVSHHVDLHRHRVLQFAVSPLALRVAVRKQVERIEASANHQPASGSLLEVDLPHGGALAVGHVQAAI